MYVFTEKGSTEIYKNIILLHCYITAADLLTNCDAVTAIMHLATVSEKYKDILAGLLTLSDRYRCVVYEIWYCES